jgi:hypothetical protein
MLRLAEALREGLRLLRGLVETLELAAALALGLAEGGGQAGSCTLQMHSPFWSLQTPCEPSAEHCAVRVGSAKG